MMKELEPAMPSRETPDGGDARWVGLVELEEVDPEEARIGLVNATGYHVARILVRDHGTVRGYVTLPVHDDAVTVAELLVKAGGLPTVLPPEPMVSFPPMSVVVCTRERPELLREALGSLLAQDYPDFEVVVVDNAPITGDTAAVAAEFDVRYIVEPIAGVSRARNAGLAAVRHDLVAFTDDDVIADRLWLQGIARGFDVAPDIACVSGLVPSGELRNSVQAYFDARVSWSRLVSPRVFRLAEPPVDLPLFPFCVGEFGTGANFAVRRDAVLDLGGFDLALGVGTRTKGGEDLDLFTRLLFAGHGLMVQPGAIIWHRHRDDLAALKAQAIGYGRGLGAWLSKVVIKPHVLAMAIRRSPKALARLVRKPMATVEDGTGGTGESSVLQLGADVVRIGRTELFQVLTGPGYYARERIRQNGLTAELDSAEAVA